MLRALQLERHSKCTYPWHHHEQQLICDGSETMTGNLIQQSVEGWEHFVTCIKVSTAALCLDSYMLVVLHQQLEAGCAVLCVSGGSASQIKC